jgi:hypothetical protein
VVVYEGYTCRRRSRRARARAEVHAPRRFAGGVRGGRAGVFALARAGLGARALARRERISRGRGRLRVREGSEGAALRDEV